MMVLISLSQFEVNMKWINGHHVPQAHVGYWMILNVKKVWLQYGM